MNESKPNAKKNIKTCLLCQKNIVSSVDKKYNVLPCTKPVQ